MSNELVKEKIVLSQNTGSEKTQVLIEGDLIVPDIKPDMAYILKVDATVALEDTDVSIDRVDFSGALTLKVLYLEKSSDKPVHSISTTAQINDFINIEGINKEMYVDLTSSIENISYKMQNDRKISYRALVDISATAESNNTYDVITSIADVSENQLIHRKLSINKLIENKQELLIIKEDLTVPPGKPNIRELLEKNVSIANKEIKVNTGRVSITGDLMFSTLYKGDTDEGIVDLIEHEVPFSGTIDIPAARDGMFADVSLVPSECLIKSARDHDGEDRILNAEITLKASLKLNMQSEIEVLEDVYIVNKTTNAMKQKLKYPNMICRNKNQCSIKDILELEPDCPDILQIFRVTGDVKIDEIRVLDDKISVEGIVETDILYIAKNDDAPLYNHKAFMPFKQIVETKGSLPSMHVSIEKSIDHVGFNMLSDREVEVRFLICLNTKVTENIETNIVTDIEFEDIDKSVLDKMASIIIYIVKHGDTLWSIAKRYNTSIEDIMAINDIDDPNKINIGQKLMILKKYIY